MRGPRPNRHGARPEGCSSGATQAFRCAGTGKRQGLGETPARSRVVCWLHGRAGDEQNHGYRRRVRCRLGRQPEPLGAIADRRCRPARCGGHERRVPRDRGEDQRGAGREGDRGAGALLWTPGGRTAVVRKRHGGAGRRTGRTASRGADRGAALLCRRSIERRRSEARHRRARVGGFSTRFSTHRRVRAGRGDPVPGICSGICSGRSFWRRRPPAGRSRASRGAAGPSDGRACRCS